MTSEDKHFLAVRLFGIQHDLSIIKMHVNRNRDDMKNRVNFYVGEIIDLIEDLSEEFDIDILDAFCPKRKKDNNGE